MVRPGRIAVPVSLTLLLVFIVFVPVVQSPGGGTHDECGQGGCINNIVQYESISYAYGGWGAVFQTGVNWYNVNGWVCSCPAQVEGRPNVQCCVPPFAGVVWPATGLLLLADLVSIAIVAGRGLFVGSPKKALKEARTGSGVLTGEAA